MTDNSGAAFPHQDSGDTGFRPGLTKREYFAGQALAACITATADYDAVNAMATGAKGGALEAKAACAWADALIAALAARNTKEEQGND